MIKMTAWQVEEIRGGTKFTRNKQKIKIKHDNGEEIIRIVSENPTGTLNITRIKGIMNIWHNSSQTKRDTRMKLATEKNVNAHKLEEFISQAIKQESSVNVEKLLLAVKAIYPEIVEQAKKQ